MEQKQTSDDFLKDCYKKSIFKDSCIALFLGATILTENSKQFIIWLGQKIEISHLKLLSDINAITMFSKKVAEDNILLSEFQALISKEFPNYKDCLKRASTSLLNTIYIMPFINELIYVRDAHAAFSKIQLEKLF